jgi:hypothetical protein
MKKNKNAWFVVMISIFLICSVTSVIVRTNASDDVTVAVTQDMPSVKTGKVIFEVLNPEAEIILPSEVSVINPRVKDLSDKNIGVIWCGKAGGEFFLDATAELLKKKYPSATISKYTWDVDNSKEKILKDVDTFIYGVGDTGLGAWESTSRTIALEKLGKPGVVLFGGHLKLNAKGSASSHGMPSVRMIPLPSLDFYPNRTSFESIMPCAEAALEEIIDALIRPISESERKAGIEPKKARVESIRITADNMELAHEKFNQLYMDYDWGDGLPLIPPTPYNVKRMLNGTKLPPDTILGVIPAPDGLSDVANVTVEKVAINAVMAGAKPEYLPVIIAAMEGISNKNFSPHVFTSDGSFTLFIAVTGPIAKKINMNSGTGLLGHGWRANNTIGRAVRLCLNNIGNLKPGKVDTALVGRPSSHTFYVLAENEELNPWGPYHTLRGYRAEDSYVTVSGMGGYFRGYGGGAGGPWTVEGVLDALVNEIASARAMFGSYQPGVGSGFGSRPFNYIFVLNPEMAIGLEKMGFTNKGLRDYLIDRTSVPYEDLSKQEIEGIKQRLSHKSEAFFGTDNIPDDRIPVIREALRPGGKVPVVISPDDINIFVSGNVSSYTFGASYLRGAHMVKPVR